MNTTTLTRLVSSKLKQPITENKKAELDKLTNMVISQQQTVEQLQAIVDSLTVKSAQFTDFLNTANSNKIRTLANKNTLGQLADTAWDLMQSCKIAVSAMDKSNVKTKKLAAVINDLIDKLIYSAELINKLSNTIIRQKAINPLISDDLIDMVGTAGTDANNAVALTLVALESTFAAQAANVESTSISALDYLESINLYKKLTGTKIKVTGPILEVIDIEEVLENRNTILIAQVIEICLKLRNVNIEFVKDPGMYKSSLLYLINKAYTDAATDYTHAYNANQETTNQLNVYTAELTKGQVKLASLQAGLAAATAAALAS